MVQNWITCVAVLGLKTGNVWASRRTLMCFELLFLVLLLQGSSTAPPISCHRCSFPGSQHTVSQQLSYPLREKPNRFPSLPGPQSQFTGWYQCLTFLYPLKKSPLTNFSQETSTYILLFFIWLLDDSSVWKDRLKCSTLVYWMFTMGQAPC